MFCCRILAAGLVGFLLITQGVVGVGSFCRPCTPFLISG
jgi:hypothetical protein